MMNLVFGGLLGVILIGFFVVVWKASPNWRWYNIVAVCITMILSVVFIFPTAGVLKSRSNWHQLKEKLEVQYEEVEAEQRLIKYGDNDQEMPQYGPGVVELGIELSKIGVEAGRRWPNLELQSMNNNQVVLSKPPEDAGGIAGVPTDPAAAAAPPAGAAAEPLVPADMVVYGFGEVEFNSSGVRLPAVYLGEYRVTASTPDSVTLSPTSSLEPSQRNALQKLPNFGQPVSWTLYELLPLDAHDAFIAAGSQPDENLILGSVDEDLVNQLLGNALRLTRNAGQENNPPLQTNLDSLKSYLEDGRRATDDDLPVTRWWMIEFVQTKRIDVDSPEQRGALDGGFFDLNGRAVDSRLQRPEDDEVVFKKGDRVLMKEEAANVLINEGVAELRDRYYLRPLNDYRFILRRLRLRLDDLAGRKTELEFEKQVLEQAIAKTEDMLVKNQSDKLKLEQDLSQFRVEKTAMDDYTAKMREELEQMRTEMAQIHQHNLALEQEIAQKHQAIERRLDGLSLAE